MSSVRCRTGMSLVEVLIVIALMAILAATVIPSATPSVERQLESAARVLASDLGFARSLAVANASTYQVLFDVTHNRYIVEHTGGNAALDALPNTAFRNPDDPADQHIVRFQDLPHIGAAVKLAQAALVGNSLDPATNVEFGSLGQTTATRDTLIVLSAGENDKRRRWFVLVNAVTGNTSIGRTAAELSGDWTSAQRGAIDAVP